MKNRLRWLCNYIIVIGTAATILCVCAYGVWVVVRLATEWMVGP